MGWGYSLSAVVFGSAFESSWQAFLGYSGFWNRYTWIAVSLAQCACTAAVAALFHQLLLGLFKSLQLCDKYYLVLVLSWQLLSSAKRLGVCLVCYFPPASQMRFWLNGIKGNLMFSSMHTWTNEVMTVHPGWLQSQLSLTKLCFTAVMASPSSALPGLHFLWPCKTVSFLPCNHWDYFVVVVQGAIWVHFFLLQYHEYSLLLFGFLKSPAYDRWPDHSLEHPLIAAISASILLLLPDISSPVYSVLFTSTWPSKLLSFTVKVSHIHTHASGGVLVLSWSLCGKPVVSNGKSQTHLVLEAGVAVLLMPSIFLDFV